MTDLVMALILIFGVAILLFVDAILYKKVLDAEGPQGMEIAVIPFVGIWLYFVKYKLHLG